MDNKLKKRAKAAIFIGIPLLAVVVYFMYIYYYYKEITIDTFIKHTVGSLNLLGRYIRFLLGKIMGNSVAINIIVITPLLIFIGKKINIEAVINSLTNIEIGVLKISKEGIQQLKQEKVDLKKEETKEEIQQLKQEKVYLKKEETKGVENVNNEESLQNNEESKILQLILDNPDIVNLIDKFIKKSRGVTIPIQLIGVKYKLDVIAQLFNYEIKNNSVKITSIKEDIEVTLVEVYTDLKRKGLIYVENI